MIGHAGTLVAGTVRGVPTVVLSGRVHYYEGHPMPAVVFPARVLGLLGCRTVIVTNAAGGIDRSFKSGDLMLIEDHINVFGTNPLVGRERRGPRAALSRHVGRLPQGPSRRSLSPSRSAQRIPLKHGVYVGVHGPSYETPAEIRAFRALGRGRGRHVDGARSHRAQPDGRRRPRHLLHHEHGRRRVLKQKLDHREVLETTQRVKGDFVRLLTFLVQALGTGRSGATEDAFLPVLRPAGPREEGEEEVSADAGPSRPTRRNASSTRRGRRATNASAPYSGFRVGAALLAEDGTIFGGCNVESASYGLTVCGERTAVFKAISEGARKFRAVAVVTDADPPASPCGACRQVLWDQCRDIDVILATPARVVSRMRLSTLLPLAFEFERPK